MKTALLCIVWVLMAAAAGAAGPDPLVSEALNRKTYVFAEFTSKTCPACDEMKPIVKSVLAKHRRVLHQVHDADLEVELSKKYQVKCVPVYVIVDPKGEIRFNDVGMHTEEELDEILKSAGVARR